MAPITTSIFEDSGSLRPSKSNSLLKTNGTKAFVWKRGKPNFVVIDGCAILYIIDWPSKALIHYYVENVYHYVLRGWGQRTQPLSWTVTMISVTMKTYDFCGIYCFKISICNALSHSNDTMHASRRNYSLTQTIRTLYISRSTESATVNNFYFKTLEVMSHVEITKTK